MRGEEFVGKKKNRILSQGKSAPQYEELPDSERERAKREGRNKKKPHRHKRLRQEG